MSIRSRTSSSRPVRPTAGVEEWRAHTGTIVGGADRLDGALILPYPNRSSDTAEVNRFVVDATRGHDGIRAALLATPECDPDGIDGLAEPQIGGLQGLLVLRRRPRRPAAGGRPRSSCPSGCGSRRTSAAGSSPCT